MKGLRSFIQELSAIIRLSRWGNLLFLFVLQTISLFYIYFFDSDTALHLLPVAPHLLLSTSMIAAAGYLINDYFDMPIDQINKPQRVITIKKYGKRALIKWHIIFTVIGILLAIYACSYVGKMRLIIIQLLSVGFLFIYSFIFKKKILIGNLIISILSVLSLLLMPLYAYASLLLIYLRSVMPESLMIMFTAVAVFSFMLTLIREVVKDCEDIAGDIQHGCRTLPVVVGTSRTNIIIVFLVMFTMVLYAIYFSALISNGNIFSTLAFLLFEVAMIGLGYMLYHSRLATDYSRASNYIKFLMAYGLFTSIILMYYV